LAAAADLLGQGWSLLVVAQLLDGPRRYDVLVREITTMSGDQIDSALSSLRASGLVAVVAATGDAALYGLTERGLALAPAVDALAAWGRLAGGQTSSGSVGA